MYNCAQVIGEYLKPLCEDNPYIIKNTQDFAKFIRKQPPLMPDEELVSYDVDSLFTNVPINETIDYILDEIYVHNKLPKLSTKLVFKRLLLKLTTESTFIFQSQFYKQTDGCTMGGPLSVIFSNIFLSKLEKEKVLPLHPPMYKRFVDDVINKRKKNIPDSLLETLQNYHPKINFSVEINPEKFLDTRLINNNGKYATAVYRKPMKYPSPWTSHVPKRYKRNAIIGDLAHASRIASNFQQEQVSIHRKFTDAGFPIRFVDSVIRQYNTPKPQPENDDDDFIIPPGFFDLPPRTIAIELPFCERNERAVKSFIHKLRSHLMEEIEVRIIWKTKKVKQLFRLKDKNPYPACVIYEGTCSCGEGYVGETKRNAETRWSEHNNPDKDSEPARHLRSNIDHVFEWKILMSAPHNTRLRKYIEAGIIAMKRPPLNDQVKSKKLHLFRNGVT